MKHCCSALLSSRGHALGAVLVAVQCLVGCSEQGVPADEVRRVVERDALFWSGEAVPAEVVGFLAGQKLLIVGEQHKSRDHDLLWASLVPLLHQAGVRQWLLEWPHAADWRLNAYARGDAGLGWQPAEFLDGQLLRAIRTLNQRLPPEERIAVRPIDANHAGYGARAFADYLSALALHLGDAAELTTFSASYPGDAAGQRQALGSLRDHLASERDSLVLRWGQQQYDLVLEMTEVESESIEVRDSWDRDYEGAFRRREDVMKRLAERRLAETSARTIASVGGSHAQKERQRGTQQEWLGDYLVHRSPLAAGQTLTLWMAAGRGEYLLDNASKSFDLREQSPENEVLRIVSEVAGSRTALLPLSDPMFLERQVAVNYLEDIFVCSPKRQYDAFFVTPETHLADR
jgi:hypothetical protein